MDCLRRIVRALQTASRARPTGTNLTGAQLWIMQRISRTPGISLTELAAQTLTNSSTVSEVAARLASSGYVRRVSHDSDARKITLTLTRRGATALRASAQPVQEKLAEALAAMAPRDVAQLAETLEKWISGARLQRTPASLLGSNGDRP